LKLPCFVTFTGPDDDTDIDRLIGFKRKYSVEFGILFSANQQNNGRYPSLDFIERLHDRGLALSAHICGRYAREIAESGECEDLRKTPFSLDRMWQRVQVNLPRDAKVSNDNIRKFAHSVGAVPILQTRGNFPKNEDVNWLYDPSGGTGRDTHSWPDSSENRAFCGYAGGIGPQNVEQVITALQPLVRSQNYWIDMETKVRTNDKFDLDKVEYVLETVYPGGIF
jgi:hypothetical protein